MQRAERQGARSCAKQWSGAPTCAQRVALLRRHLRARYRGPIETIETHFAWVLLTSRLAFKLKKPLCQPPMDYRALSARRWGCEQELRLNRRLAPLVYRSVVPLVITSAGVLRLGGAGRIVDYVVKMHRLPAKQMLDRLLTTGLTRQRLDRLVQALARFFATADSRPMSGAAYLRRLRAQLALNHSALRRVRGLDRRQIDRIHIAQRRLLELDAARLATRGARLVDGHGDLRAEHVQLGRTVQVIDCLEFDRELRRLDPMQDLALLALEIDGLGQAHLARRLLRRYCQYTGETIGAAELWFYVSHNAMTRAKLSGWHIGDPQFPDARPWLRRAESYMRQALSAIQSAQRALSTVPGSATRPVHRRRAPPRYLRNIRTKRPAMLALPH